MSTGLEERRKHSEFLYNIIFKNLKKKEKKKEKKNDDW